MRAWPVLAALAAMLPAPAAQAQSSACEQLKATLAARISRGGFTIEDVPADTPLPPGAKVIGNCEAGARKVLLLRSDAPQPAPVASAATRPAASPTPAPVPTPTPTPEPVAQAVLPASASAEPAKPNALPLAQPSFAQSAVELFSRHWPWLLGAALLLPLALWLAAWIAHRRAYDEAGLPRGPRLN